MDIFPVNMRPLKTALIFVFTSLNAHINHKTQTLSRSDKETDMGDVPKLI